MGGFVDTSKSIIFRVDFCVCNSAERSNTAKPTRKNAASQEFQTELLSSKICFDL